MTQPSDQHADNAAGETIRLFCNRCFRPISSPVPVDTVLRGWALCPECYDIEVQRCELCKLAGEHAHQTHLWTTSNQDGSGRVRITECAACTAPRLANNLSQPCPALLRVEGR